jgi:hypothetical protein
MQVVLQPRTQLMVEAEQRVLHVERKRGVEYPWTYLGIEANVVSSLPLCLSEVRMYCMRHGSLASLYLLVLDSVSRATTVTHQSPSVVEEWGCGKDVPTLTLPPRPHRPSTPHFCTPPLRPRNPSTTKQQPDCKRQIICRPRSRGSFAMVLQDLGRRINSAVSDLTRAPNLDEKASSKLRVAGGWLSRNVATMSCDPHE